MTFDELLDRLVTQISVEREIHGENAQAPLADTLRRDGYLGVLDVRAVHEGQGHEWDEVIGTFELKFDLSIPLDADSKILFRQEHLMIQAHQVLMKKSRNRAIRVGVAVADEDVRHSELDARSVRRHAGGLHARHTVRIASASWVDRSGCPGFAITMHHTGFEHARRKARGAKEPSVTLPSRRDDSLPPEGAEAGGRAPDMGEVGGAEPAKRASTDGWGHPRTPFEAPLPLVGDWPVSSDACRGPRHLTQFGGAT